MPNWKVPFRKEAFALYEKIKANYSIDDVTLFMHDRNRRFKCLFSTRELYKRQFITLREIPKQTRTIYNYQERKGDLFSPLFSQFSFNQLHVRQLKENNTLICTINLNIADPNPAISDLIFQLFCDLFIRHMYAFRLQKRGQRYRQVLSEVQGLHQISHAIKGSENIDHLLNFILEKAQSIIGSESASLMLTVPKTEELEFKVVLGPRSADVKPFRIKLGQGITGWVAQNKKPLLIQDAYKDARFDSSVDKKTGYTTKTILCVPMLHNTNCVGVMTVINPINNRTFNEEDKNLMLNFASQAALAIENRHLLNAAIEKERLDSELQVATEIQNLILPQTLPQIEQLDLAAMFIPCREVSGDFYDIIKISETRTAIIMADVAGKGIPAAMLVSTMQAMLTAYLEAGHNLVTILDHLNKNLIKKSTDDQFITCFLALYDSSIETLHYVNAGHNPPILLQDGKIRLLKEGGILLGSFPWTYERTSVKLKKDAILTLYTDGLVEALNDQNAPFTDLRLEGIIEKNSHQDAQGILTTISEKVNQHLHYNKMQDDFTLVVAKKRV